MGVGTPEDLLEAVARGIDMFDCVMPTRNGRHGMAFTRFGQINLRNAAMPTIRGRSTRKANGRGAQHSRAYLHHLVRSGETLGAMLLSEINVRVLPAPDARHARGDRRRYFRDVPKANARRLGEGRYTAALVGSFSHKGHRPGPRLQAGHRLGQRNVGL
jgi:hypothetical protein